MNTALWESIDLMNITGGKASGEWSAASVSIDSRTLQAGALYVALKGDRVDGHDYVKAAFERGATAAAVSAPIAGVAPEKLLVVADTAKALTALGHAARKRSNAIMIGVTGSIGKTTTKEMLALMCSAFGRSYATKGNFNNHFGVPLMLANMPLDTEFGVFEMGMNHEGEITVLTKMVQPHVAVITNVEAVHLEFFESVDEIADAKSEIFDGLLLDGIAVLNRDNAYFKRCLKHAQAFHPKQILSFGRHNEANVHLQCEAQTDAGTILTINIENKRIVTQMEASGEGPIIASLIAMAVAEGLKLDLERAAKALAAFKEVEGRGRLQKVDFEGKTMWWIDDSYNAGPASMASAFTKLANAAKNIDGASRSVAVLGDMLELGEDTAKFHTELAVKLQAAHIDGVYTSGRLMKGCYDALPPEMRGAHINHVDGLESILRAELMAGDVVLFKGSHGSKIYTLVEKLQSAKKNP